LADGLFSCAKKLATVALDATSVVRETTPEQKKDAKLTKAEQEAVDNVVRKAKGRNAVERIISSSLSRKWPGYVIFGLSTATLLHVRVDLLKAHVVSPESCRTGPPGGVLFRREKGLCRYA